MHILKTKNKYVFFLSLNKFRSQKNRSWGQGSSFKAQLKPELWGKEQISSQDQWVWCLWKRGSRPTRFNLRPSPSQNKVLPLVNQILMSYILHQVFCQDQRVKSVDLMELVSQEMGINAEGEVLVPGPARPHVEASLDTTLKPRGTADMYAHDGSCPTTVSPQRPEKSVANMPTLFSVFLRDTSGQGRFCTIFRSYSRGAQVSLQVTRVKHTSAFTSITSCVS